MSSTIIDMDAFQAILLGTLSCGCPISASGEAQVVEYWNGLRHEKQADFGKVLDLLSLEPASTPFHMLYQYCLNKSDTPLSLHIGINDVLRYLGSQYHYGRLTAGAPDHSDAMSPFFIAHMLLPVRLQENGRGVYNLGKTNIFLKNICKAPWKLPPSGPLAAVHFGLVLCGLTERQFQLLLDHQSLIPDFVRRAAQTAEIDFANLPQYGNHSLQMAKRMGKYLI